MSAALSATSRRQSAAVGQKRPDTSVGGRFECSGRGHGRIQPFLHWSETATTHATSSLRCDVVRGRSTEGEVASRGPAALGRWVESNHVGSHGRAHLSNRIFTAHTNLPVLYYFTVLMFIGFGQKQQSQQIVRSGSLSSSLPTRSMAATSSACVTAVQNASYLRCSQLRREI